MYKTRRVGFCFVLTPARHTERSVHYQCMSFRLCAIVFFYFVGVSLFITMPNHTIVEYLKVYILCGLLKRHFNSENDVKNKICGVLCKCILLESVSLSLDSGINSSSRQSIISKPWIFEFVA